MRNLQKKNSPWIQKEAYHLITDRSCPINVCVKHYFDTGALTLPMITVLTLVSEDASHILPWHRRVTQVDRRLPSALQTTSSASPAGMQAGSGATPQNIPNRLLESFPLYSSLPHCVHFTEKWLDIQGLEETIQSWRFIPHFFPCSLRSLGTVHVAKL